MLERVRVGEVLQQTLQQRLTEYVERIDTDMVSCSCFTQLLTWQILHASLNHLEGLITQEQRLAGRVDSRLGSGDQTNGGGASQALEYQVAQGVAEGTRQELYLVPLGAQHEYGPELHSNVCVVKLLQT